MLVKLLCDDLSKVLVLALVSLLLPVSFSYLQLVKSAMDFSRKILDVPMFKQCGRWYSDEQLGFCPGKTVCSHGCAVCSVAMVFKYYGVRTNPSHLNRWLKENDGYVKGCNINWSRAAGISKKVRWAGVNRSVTMADIKAEIDRGYPCVAKERGRRHFFVVKGYSGSSTLYINDPSSGRTKVDISQVERIMKYHGTPREWAQVRWVRYSNPSYSLDLARSVCVHGRYVYITGLAGDMFTGRGKGRIEMRRKSDGKLVKSWTGSLWPHDCLFVGNRLMVVGYSNGTMGYQWTILVFNTKLKLLKSVRRNYGEFSAAYSLVYDDSYVYVLGDEIVHAVDLDSRWRIEKLDPEDLKLLKTKTIDPTSGIDMPGVIRLNPVTKQLWVTGYGYGGGKISKPFLLILSRNLKVLKKVKLREGEYACDIAFDENGYAYVNTWFSLLKFNKKGKLIRSKPFYQLERIHPAILVYWNGYLVIAGRKSVNKYERHILAALNKDLILKKEAVLSSKVQADSFLIGDRMSIDGDNLYVAGWDKAKDEGRWVIYSVKLAPT